LADEVTELRVHGVGGTSPQALLDDLAPEQVGGDRLAGFYRTAGLAPAEPDGRAARRVEAYSWGGLTSQSDVRVLWLLLLPFMLANLAGWMYRGPVTATADGRQRGVLFACHRVTTGLACLALTVNSVLVGVLLSGDLVAYQATRNHLTNRWWLWPLTWPWVRGHGERPLLLGFAVVAIGVALLVALAVRSQQRYEAVRPPWLAGSVKPRPTSSAADRTIDHREFWDTAPAVRRVSGAHIAAAVGFLAVTFAITAKAASGAVQAQGWWWLAVVAGGLALAAATAVVATDHWAELLPWRAGRRWYRFVPHAVAPVGLVAAAVFSLRQPALRTGPVSLPGLGAITGLTYLALGGTIALLVLVGVVGAVHARLSGHPSPGKLWGGPAVLMLLAAGLLNAMLLGLLAAVGHALGLLGDGRGATVPDAVGWAAPVLDASIVVSIVAYAVVQLPRMLSARSVSGAVDTAVQAYRNGLAGAWPSRTPDEKWAVGMVEATGEPRPALDDAEGRTSWLRRITRAYWFGRAFASAVPLLWLVVALQAGGMIAIVVARPPFQDAGIGPYSTLGDAMLWLGTAALIALMWLLRKGWQDPTDRRRIGVLWDVGTFWPRSHHPLAPPCYAERAVPDLQRRIWRLTDHGSPVVVVSHSQGTVLAAAALAQQDCRGTRGRVGLVTFGCPLTKLYTWGFPAYFDDRVLRSVGQNTKGRTKVVRWNNFAYPTDPIGGPLTVGPTDAVRHDVELLDPAAAWHIYGDPVPGPGGHSGYWTDPRVWTSIDAMADALRMPVEVVVGPKTDELAALLRGHDDAGLIGVSVVARAGRATLVVATVDGVGADVVLDPAAPLAAQVESLWSQRIKPFAQLLVGVSPAESPIARPAADPDQAARRLLDRIRAGLTGYGVADDTWAYDHVRSSSDGVELRISATALPADSSAMADVLLTAGFLPAELAGGYRYLADVAPRTYVRPDPRLPAVLSVVRATMGG
jgi:hypothetical protein